MYYSSAEVISGHTSYVVSVSRCALSRCIYFYSFSVEFLFDNNISVPTIKNYLSSIKSLFKLYNVHIMAFQSPQVSMALASLSKNCIPSVICKPIFSPSQFLAFINHTLNFPLHLFYIIAFIFVFFRSPPNFKRGPGF
jgi:hypothetical protein